MSQHLHIVCLDAPSPPDYGGAIDMFYKIAALAASGKKIILHYFNYRPNRSASGLEKYCIEINAYNRKTGLAGLRPFQPYIVSSRINRQLINRLNQDDYPVLLEGVHCYGIVSYLRPHRSIVLRMHNDEAVYYGQLGRAEKNVFRKMYFFTESWLLRFYQKKILRSIPQACLSRTDLHSLSRKYGANNLHYIPAFIPWQTVNNLEGKGSYCLYHGNMSVAENEQAAVWLIRNVFSILKLPLIIAGKNMPGRIRKEAQGYSNIQLAENPTDGEMGELIRQAQINVLPSFNSTGLKLKILHALFEGRYCLTNNAGIAGTDYAAALHTANTPEQFRKAITGLMDLPLSAEELGKKAAALAAYNNKENAARLNALW
jgi:hypothetical protein